MQRTIPALFCLMLIQGCASQKPAFTESFLTSINETDSRRFTYEVTFEDRGDTRSGPPTRGRDGMMTDRRLGSAASMPARMRRNTEKAILERLDAILVESAFCNRGYFIYRKNFTARSAQLLGECKSG